MTNKHQAVVKQDTAENWAKALNYIPLPNTIIIYNYSDSPPRLKMGNGKDYVNDLPFILSTNTPQISEKTLEF